MKKTLLSVIAFLMTAVCAYSQNFDREPNMPPVQTANMNRMPAKASTITPTESQMWWGYYSESDYAGINYGYSKAATFDAYIYIPGGTEMVANSTIKAMRMWFGSGVSAVTDLKIWISRTRPDNVSDADYVQTVNVSNVESGVNEILLNTPFNVGSSGIYVGYTATTSSGTYFIGACSGPTPNAFFYRNSINNTLKDYSYEDKLALQILLDGGTYPTNLAMAEDFGQGFVLKGESVSLPVSITNKGKNPIESISYVITTNNSSPTEERTISISPLSFNGQVNLSISFASDAQARKYNKEVTITKVNGVTNNCSQNKATGSIITVSEKPAVMPVVEEFTGTWCGYCPYGIEGMKKAHETFGDQVALIAVHSGDVMEVSAYSPVISKYASGYPSSRINREGGSIYPSPSITNSLSRALNRSTVGSVSLTASWVDEDKTKVKFDTKTKFVYNEDDGEYGIAFVLVEDGLKGESSGWSQANYLSGGSGESYMSFWYDSPSSVSGLEFDHVAVAAWSILSGVSGSVKSQFSAGEVQNFSYTGDLNQFSLIQDKSKLTAIALLINNANGIIVNAAQVKIGEPGETPQPTNIRGDVNNDGIVDVADIATIINIMAGKE